MNCRGSQCLARCSSAARWQVEAPRPFFGGLWNLGCARYLGEIAHHFSMGWIWIITHTLYIYIIIYIKSYIDNICIGIEDISCGTRLSLTWLMHQVWRPKDRQPGATQTARTTESVGVPGVVAFEALEENGIGQHAGVFVFPLKLVTLINGPNQWWMMVNDG